MAVICYSVQRQYARGIEYRNPRWFSAPLFRPGDRIVVCGHWPDIVAAYESRKVSVTAQAGPYLGDTDPEPDPQTEPAIVDEQPPAVTPPKVTDRQVEPEPARELISMTKAELQAEASRRGMPYKADASRTDLLALLGGR